MSISFGKDICTNLASSQTREWIVTNGIGGYGAGTISGLLTRRYHGLLIAALQPPTRRTLLLTKLNETVSYNNLNYDLYCDRWADGTIFPHGYDNISQFFLVGSIPVWQYQILDAVVEKRIWMQQGENTTYIRYTLIGGSQPISLSLDALVNYRDHHGDTHAHNWRMNLNTIDGGIKVTASQDATALYLLASSSNHHVTWKPVHVWLYNYHLAVEKYRGLIHCEDNLLVGTCTVTLKPGESITIVASTEPNPNSDINYAWKQQYSYEQEILTAAKRLIPESQSDRQPEWIDRLILAADSFIVGRPTDAFPEGKTVIAGYPWFSDWGRDTMISLPGLTLATGRPSVARSILGTFARYVDRGMLPNVFPDGGESPDYNTVDATLWYFEAIYSYFLHTKDKSLIAELFPILADIITHYCQGTRYNIHQDSDGLLYAGEAGVQLTWMDAKVDDWVVTPRIGKPIEINALWYNALVIMEQFAVVLEHSPQEYNQLANSTRQGFQRFWSSELGYCYDVLDTIDGNDASLRPNQIFAVSLPSYNEAPALLNFDRQKSVVDAVKQELLTPYGLRSLSPKHPDYQGHYGGDRHQRDGAYHQGTVWAWLIGHFIQAHLKVYRQPKTARSFLMPMAKHLETGCVGTISEIFDGDSPFTYRGCFAQAWSVAEVLRVWQLINRESTSDGF